MQSTGRGAAKLGGQGAGWCGGHLHEAERREMARRDDHAEGQEQEGAKDQPLHYLLKLPLPLAVRLGRSRWRAGRVLLVESVVAGIGVGSRLRLRRLPVAQRGRHWNEGDEGTRAAGGRGEFAVHRLAPECERVRAPRWRCANTALLLVCTLSAHPFAFRRAFTKNFTTHTTTRPARPCSSHELFSPSTRVHLCMHLHARAPAR